MVRTKRKQIDSEDQAKGADQKAEKDGEGGRERAFKKKKKGVQPLGDRFLRRRKRDLTKEERAKGRGGVLTSEKSEEWQRDLKSAERGSGTGGECHGMKFKG